MPWRLKSFLATLFVATMVALGVRLLLIENYRIVSDSMAPNLRDGALVMISKLSFNIHLPFSSYEVVRLRRPRPGDEERHSVVLRQRGQVGKPIGVGN